MYQIILIFPPSCCWHLLISHSLQIFLILGRCWTFVHSLDICAVCSETACFSWYQSKNHTNVKKTRNSLELLQLRETSLPSILSCTERKDGRVFQSLGRGLMLGQACLLISFIHRTVNGNGDNF